MNDATENDLKTGQKWLDKIERAGKREETWRIEGEYAEKVYLGEEPTVKFNILHSNVETIVPSLYNSTAIPDIRARHNRGADDTPAYRASQVLEACISVQTDDNVFDDAIERMAQSAFISGRGIVRVKIEKDHQTGRPMVIYESVSFKDFRMGSARLWRDVPFVAFRHWLSPDQLEDMADTEIAEALKAGNVPNHTWPCDSDDDTATWEVWDKATREVLFITDTGIIIKCKRDVLGLRHFFPMAAPTQPIVPTDSLTPVCPFAVYKSLNDDLQHTSNRISALTKSCRAVGIFVGNAAEIDRLHELEDGQLLAIDMPQGAAGATRGIEANIAYWPVEKVIQVLRELYVSRDQIKQAIYEITGISDIVRGQTDASETATAQDIKSRWGSLRIRKLQTLIERTARDLFGITAELICNVFEEEDILAIYGQQIDPETMQLLTGTLNHFRINVETNSTVRNDQNLIQSEMAQLLQGTAQYFQTMAPLMQDPAFAAAMGPIIKFYSAFARTFNLGRQADDAIEELIAQLAQYDPTQKQQQAEQAQQKAQELEERKVAVTEDRLRLDEANAEVDGVLKVAEYDLEAEQQRPVALGEQE